MFCWCLQAGRTGFFLLRGPFHVNPKLPFRHRKKRINPPFNITSVCGFFFHFLKWRQSSSSSSVLCHHPLLLPSSLTHKSTCRLVHPHTYPLNLQLENGTLNPSLALFTGCFQCRDILGTPALVFDTFISPNPSSSPLPSALILCLFSLSRQRAPD